MSRKFAQIGARNQKVRFLVATFIIFKNGFENATTCDKIHQEVIKMFNIVLVEPEIPQNTGNIVRTCAATGCRLHLVKPLGFEVSDKYLKRAGLDYWQYADITYWESFDELQKANADGTFYYFTTKGRKRHCDAQFKEGDFLVFGKETKGLPEQLIHDNYKTAVRIPMLADTRSLNLSNSVAIAVYEVLRQHNFDGLNFVGHLREFDD